ncbi:hypothetical protein HDU96_010236 [Phlyctochytrium bullatum]|nr:hypothetical protein HDU96_010236 [Phlyctochytrium bullatum]
MGNLNMLKFFLEHPLSERNGDLEGTAVVVAAAQNLGGEDNINEVHDDIVKLLLSSGFDVNHQCSYGDTPLMISDLSSSKVKFYLENGVDILLTAAHHGNNVMHLAILDQVPYDNAKAIIAALPSLKDPSRSCANVDELAPSDEPHIHRGIDIGQASPSIFKHSPSKH